MSECHADLVAAAIESDKDLAERVASAWYLRIRSGQIDDLAKMQCPIRAHKVTVYHRDGTPDEYIDSQPNLVSVEEIHVVLMCRHAPNPNIVERIVRSLTRFSGVPLTKLVVKSRDVTVDILMQPLLRMHVGGQAVMLTLRQLKLERVSLSDMGELAVVHGVSPSLDRLELVAVPQFLGLLRVSKANVLEVYSPPSPISREEARWIMRCGVRIVLLGDIDHDAEQLIQRHTEHPDRNPEYGTVLLNEQYIGREIRRPPGYRPGTTILAEREERATVRRPSGYRPGTTSLFASGHQHEG